MRRMVFVLVAGGALAGVVASMAPASGQAEGEAAPLFGVTIPPGYRDWRLIAVAHEEGNLNDLRAILGNDVAIQASRDGTLPWVVMQWTRPCADRLQCATMSSRSGNSWSHRRRVQCNKR